MNNTSHTVVKTAGVNCEFDTDNVNISAMTSPSSSNMADSMAADDPLWENSAVAVVKAAKRFPSLHIYNQHIDKY